MYGSLRWAYVACGEPKIQEVGLCVATPERYSKLYESQGEVMASLYS